MHGEESIEYLRAHKVIVRNGQLNPHQQRLRSGEDQKDERIDDVHDADLLVVHGGEPLVYDARPGGMVCGRDQVYGFQGWGFVGHVALLSNRWLMERGEI